MYLMKYTGSVNITYFAFSKQIFFPQSWFVSILGSYNADRMSGRVACDDIKWSVHWILIPANKTFPFMEIVAGNKALTGYLRSK